MTLRARVGRPLLFHVALWHGKNGAPSKSGYISTDPNVIGDQLSAYQALGGDDCGVTLLTYGPTVSPFIHAACMEMAKQCNSRRIPFGLCFDPWTVKNLPAGTTKEAAMIAALMHSDTQWMLSSRMYLPERYIFEFDTGCNFDTVTAGLKASVVPITRGMFLSKHTGFSWPETYKTLPDKTIVPLTNDECILQYVKDNANPTMRVPGACWQFDNRDPKDPVHAIWDKTRAACYMPSMGGSFFWDQVATAPPVWAPNGTPYLQIVTANDYDEGTAFEPQASIMFGEIGR